MNIKNMKNKLGALLREYITMAHLRQTDIAELLGVSNSAISQMLGGKIVPSQIQLEKFCEKVAIDRKKYLELTSLLSRIRSGFDELRSPFNHILFGLRCQNSITEKALGRLCGIKVARIRELEHDFQAVPTPEEQKSLAAALHCPESELLFSAQAGGGDIATTPTPLELAPILNSTVRESTSGYRIGGAEALLSLTDFDDYSAQLDLFDFTEGKSSRENIGSPVLPVRTVALRTGGKNLNLLWDGMVVLHLTSERPSGYFKVEFCRMKTGEYRLRELKGRTWRDFATRSRRRANAPIVWSIPVLAFEFVPTRDTAENKE